MLTFKNKINLYTLLHSPQAKTKNKTNKCEQAWEIRHGDAKDMKVEENSNNVSGTSALRD